ncbi:ABC transporter permease [Orenia metallireducens]|jgi:raffinose/stachyose/melibiose transport system permease protein|uniref:ABC transporter permease n=1 Tax=Orenia metallireducens TaxID=1413210 RepID=A0A1C0AC97_9FIRM|nr:sugar ABC transporter permease [Orenia metallireducens]OCL27978.1 ABC transporter permease [Orenia metallireducens]
MKRSKSEFWGFVGPSLFAFALVVIIPLIFGIYYSFTDWDGISSQINFIGLSNYVEVFKDKSFVDAFIFTSKFTIASVITINLIGFSLAILVTRGMKISNLLRTIFFMPNLIGGLILGFIWNFIFTKGFASLGELTGQRWLMGWLSNQETGFWGLVILMAWQMSGYMMVIYIAAIQNIPQELVEASQIDGANAWERTKHIIFPLVRPAFTVSLFLTLSNSFKLFDQNLSLTAGGPANSTQMLALDIYNTAFKFNEMGVAQAKAVIFFLIVGGVTLTQVYFTKKGEVEM